MAISLGGLATGLDTNALIQQLLRVEQQPITVLETKRLRYQALAAAFQDLNLKLVTLKGRADALRDPARVFARSAASSDATVLTATAAPGSQRGAFSITVSGLAKGSIAAAGNTTGATTDPVAAGPGTFAFRLGTGGPVHSIAIDGATTLADLVTAINDKQAGVKASAVNVGTAGAPAYKLTLTSTATGAANDIVILTDQTTLAVASTQTATDAAFTVAGLGSFTRATNTFSDVIEGVTITLTKPSGSAELTVEYDRAATQARVQALLDAYNDVVRTIDAQTHGGPGKDGRPTPGAFTGDALTRQIRQALAAAIAAHVGGSLPTLAQVGVTTEKDGTLALDAARFQQALADDPAGVGQLLAGTGSTSGVADLLWTAVEAATRSVSGTIAIRQDGITLATRRLQQQIDTATDRLATQERILRDRFAHLETLVSRLQSSGSSLLAQLESLARSLDASRR
jgi:flagellar hook-associated protein 2